MCARWSKPNASEGCFIAPSQREEGGETRGGEETEKGWLARYRGARAADALGPRIASGYPAIKPNARGLRVAPWRERDGALKIITGDIRYTPWALSRKRRDSRPAAAAI